MQLAEPSTPRTPRNGHKQRSARLTRLVIIAAGLAVGLTIAWQSTVTLWGSFGGGHRVPIWDLDWQASHRAWDVDSQVKAEVQAMFEQINIDFAPFRQSNISLEMVEQAYCSCRRSGFRFQSIDSKLYVVGELAPWQSRQEFIKHQLLDLLRIDGSLPDVDIYFGSTDFPEPCTTEDMPPQCQRRGPHFQHTKTMEDDWIIMHPDETFGGWPESKIAPWPETQQVLTMSASSYPWSKRHKALFFAGANLGFQRRNVSLLDWRPHPEMDIRWVNWADPHTLVPLHDFCQFRHLLHLSGCSWSSRLKYLMLCRATIVFPSSPYLEFWYRALTPGKNVLIAPEIVALDSGMQLVKIAQRLINDEPLALRLAAGAQATALHTLSPENLREYWRRLLRTYSSLMTYKPSMHPDAVPLHCKVYVPIQAWLRTPVYQAGQDRGEEFQHEQASLPAAHLSVGGGTIGGKPIAVVSQYKYLGSLYHDFSGHQG